MRVGRREFLAGVGAVLVAPAAKAVAAMTRSQVVAPAASTPGKITPIAVTTGGCGYTSAPVIRLPSGCGHAHARAK